MEDSERVYHRNDFGYSVKCACHDAVHLNFGTVSILLSSSQLSDFSKYLDQIASAEYIVDEYERNICIPTRDINLMIMLSFKELNELRDLLSQTLVSIEIEKLLD